MPPSRAGDPIIGEANGMARGVAGRLRATLKAGRYQTTAVIPPST